MLLYSNLTELKFTILFGQNSLSKTELAMLISEKLSDASMWYVVHVHHAGSGHGEESNPICITQYFCTAMQASIQASKSAEKSGFVFTNESYIAISLVRDEIVLNKVRSNDAVVCIVRLFKGRWQYQWFDSETEAAWKRLVA